MKKYLTSLNIVFAVEIVVVVLACLGLIPREAVLFLTGLMAFYMIFSSPEDSLYLTVRSVPLFVALPLADSFDSMANWRILVAVLFLCVFFKHGISLSLTKVNGRWRLRENLRHYVMEYLAAGAFLLICALSIFVADYKGLAVKKLLFLINAGLLYVVVRNMASTREVARNLIKSAAVSVGVVLSGAFIQLVVVLLVPLFTFWQFWTEKVISVFYGGNLSDLLSYSNTWFAYYAVNPPTLRLFSVFPDSHSMAMFLILAVPFLISLAFFSKTRNKKIFSWALAILSLGGIILSGSRGAWVGLVPVVFVGLYLFSRKTDNFLLKKAMITFLIFVVLFVLSSFYPPVLYKFQSWQGGGNASTTFSFFERAKSISRLNETSNKGRLEIWETSAKALVKYPFLGVGLGNYVTVLNEDVSAAKKGASAHNLYLDFANEIGIFGALLLLVIFFEILRNAWLVFRRSKEDHFRAFGLFFGLYFLWVMTYSLFDVVLLNDKVLLFFFMGVGLLYSMRRIERVE